MFLSRADTCIRTEKENRGFDFTQSSKEKIADAGDVYYIDDYLWLIANRCSLSHSEVVPGTDDCGFHLLTNVIYKSLI